MSRSCFPAVLLSLTAFMLMLSGFRSPALAQERPVNANEIYVRRCHSAISQRLRVQFLRIESLTFLGEKGDITSTTLSPTEERLRGRGQFVLANGEQRLFSYTCLVNTQTNLIVRPVYQLLPGSSSPR